MKKYSTVVIGGGAAGIVAAIGTARRGESVIICEKMPQLGKKILASGNGRCNLLNEDLKENYYNSAAREMVKSIFEKFGKLEILDFFKGLGLELYSREGRIFPATNQAASVLRVLEMELKRLSVPVEYGFDCNNVSSSKNVVIVSSTAGVEIGCRKLILAGGGKTYPALGSDGSVLQIAARLGHSLIEPVPSAVPLVVKDQLCFRLQGQRISAEAAGVIGGRVGEKNGGELLFTKYGLSGTCILDVSEEISIALNRRHKKEVFVTIDMVPFMSEELLGSELKRRRTRGYSPEDILVGILPNKFGTALQDIFKHNDMRFVAKSLKDRRFRISGTRGWNEAEFTAGGICVSEIERGTLESKIKRGIYFAGEVIDVNGRRGGYNLAWAWASGFIAGNSPSSR